MADRRGGRNVPDLKELQITVRSILMTYKEGCSVDKLIDEYYLDSGQSLPFRQFGYRSVTEMLNSWPDVARFGFSKDGQRVLFVIATEETRHIANLVRKQKSNKSKSKRPVRRPQTYRGWQRKPTVVHRPVVNIQQISKPSSRFQNNFQDVRASQNFSTFPNSSYLKRSLPLITKKESSQVKSPNYSLHEPTYAGISCGNGSVSSAKNGSYSTVSSVQFPREESAAGATGKNGLNVLHKLCQQTPATSSFSSDGNADFYNDDWENDDDFDEIFNNVLILLDDYADDVMNNLLLETSYKERYGKPLPEHWLEEMEADEDANQKLFFTHVGNLVRINKRKCNTRKVKKSPTKTSQSVPQTSKTEPEQTSSFQSKTLSSQSSNENENNSHADSTVTPKRFLFPDTDYFDIYVSVVRSPSEFVFCLKSENYEKNFYDFSNLMDNYYNSQQLLRPKKEENDYFKHSGYLFAAKDDTCWNRVSLVETLADENEAIVYFIDRGDYMKIPYTHMRKLEPDFITYPPQAIRGCLKGFENWNCDDFSDEIVEWFERFVFDANLVSCRAFLDADNRQYNNGIVSVNLLSQMIEERGISENSVDNVIEKVVNINDVITRLIKEELNRLMAEDNEGDVSDNDDYLKPSYSSRSSSIADDIVPPADQMSYTSPSFIPTGKFTNIVTISDKKPIRAENEVTVVSPPQAVYNAQLKPYTDFPEEFDVTVVMAADLFEFTVQPVSLASQLNEMNKALCDSYNNLIREPNLPKKGNFYAAFVKNSWFRAFCFDDTNLKAVSLFLVDYGEFCCCPSFNLRYLSPSCCELPMLSIQCSLYGLQSFQKFLQHKQNSDFSEKVTNKSFKMIVKTKIMKQYSNRPLMPYLEVDLIDADNDESLSEWLLQRI